MNVYLWTDSESYNEEKTHIFSNIHEIVFARAFQWAGTERSNHISSPSFHTWFGNLEWNGHTTILYSLLGQIHKGYFNAWTDGLGLPIYFATAYPRLRKPRRMYLGLRTQSSCKKQQRWCVGGLVAECQNRIPDLNGQNLHKLRASDLTQD